MRWPCPYLPIQSTAMQLQQSALFGVILARSFEWWKFQITLNWAAMEIQSQLPTFLFWNRSEPEDDSWFEPHFRTRWLKLFLSQTICSYQILDFVNKPLYPGTYFANTAPNLRRSAWTTALWATAASDSCAELTSTPWSLPRPATEASEASYLHPPTSRPLLLVTSCPSQSANGSVSITSLNLNQLLANITTD